MEQISIEKFERILPMCCGAKTSYGEGWSPDNPLHGCCAVVALLAQDFFGGDILRARLWGNSHYWNWFLDDTEHDFTVAQFKASPHPVLLAEVRTRASLLANADTKKRYELLRARFLGRI